jgi:hypothetical protein
MTTITRLMLAYSPFFVLAVAAAVGALHVVFYW